MILRNSFLIIFSLVFASSALAASSATTKKMRKSPVISQGTIQPSTQWEYLVVSFGKVLFTSPNESPETKAVGLSKLLSYSKAGIVTADEAIGTQNRMDTLGKFGWELIAIVGAIGGDQEMVFRRVYDPERTKKETLLIKQEGERLIAEQQDAAARLANSMKNTTELLDLDALEEAAATSETRHKEEDRLKEAINSIKNYPILNIKAVSTAYNSKDSRIAAEIEVDGTTALLKGNKYRSSEAMKIAKQIAFDIYRSADLSQDRYGEKDPASYLSVMLGEVKITVLLKVSFQGKSKTVATEKVGGKWPERAR